MAGPAVRIVLGDARELPGVAPGTVHLVVTSPPYPMIPQWDEQFAALDAITRLRMHDLVRDLRSKHHAAMLLVTHDIDEAIALADRIVVMSQGRITTSHRVELSAEQREVSVAREDLRAALLSDLGLANLH